MYDAMVVFNIMNWQKETNPNMLTVFGLAKVEECIHDGSQGYDRVEKRRTFVPDESG